jgi:hypothetical protein
MSRVPCVRVEFCVRFDTFFQTRNKSVSSLTIINKMLEIKESIILLETRLWHGCMQSWQR